MDFLLFNMDSREQMLLGHLLSNTTDRPMTYRFWYINGRVAAVAVAYDLVLNQAIPC